MSDNKPLKWKFKFIAVLILLFIISALVFILLTQETRPDSASERIIREAAAIQLNKDPNKLTEEDFAKITEFHISQKKLCDIKLLETFTNLKVLSLDYIPLPNPLIPKWMIVMAKLKIINLQRMYHKRYMKKYLIDLSPLENLSKLQVIYIMDSPVKDLLTLGKLESIKEIHISLHQLHDYGLIGKGKIKQQNYIIGNKSFKLEQGDPILDIFNINIQPVDPNAHFPKIVCHSSQMTWASSLQRAEMMINSNVEEALK